MLKSKLLATFYWLINGTKALNGKISHDKVTTINEKVLRRQNLKNNLNR